MIPPVAEPLFVQGWDSSASSQDSGLVYPDCRAGPNTPAAPRPSPRISSAHRGLHHLGEPIERVAKVIGAHSPRNRPGMSRFETASISSKLPYYAVGGFYVMLHFLSAGALEAPSRSFFNARTSRKRNKPHLNTSPTNNTSITPENKGLSCCLNSTFNLNYLNSQRF